MFGYDLTELLLFLALIIPLSLLIIGMILLPIIHGTEFLWHKLLHHHH